MAKKLVDFVLLLKNAGIVPDRDYRLTTSGDSEVLTEVLQQRDKQRLAIVIFAVQGLIYHFSNRKWIKNDEYLSVTQNRHTFKFNDNESEWL